MLGATIIKSLFNGTLSGDFLYESFQKDTGTRGIPSEVLNIKKILQRNTIQTFNLDVALKNDALIYQRSVEYLYPIIFDVDSKYTFSNNPSLIKSDCIIIDNENEIGLYDCKK
ncbi:hypothetical protein MCETRE41_01133 [Candidatus Methylopumilus universalis]